MIDLWIIKIFLVIILVIEKQFIKHIEIFLIFTLSIIGPTSAQRLLMAKDSTQANKALIILQLFVQFCIC